MKMINELIDDVEKGAKEKADFRSRCQCSTGNDDLNKAVSFYLKVGFEDGHHACFNILAPALMEAQKAFIGLIYDQNLHGQIVAMEALAKIRAILEGK